MIKKYLLAGALGMASLAFGQNYPYSNGYPQQQSGWYGNDDYYDDDYYDYAYNNFPDDYYYDFPTDYYPSSYYQNYYNDYRKSIVGIDWNWLFSSYNISDYQIRQIIALNNRFNSYSAWSSYYGMNPDRWYYDRFYALERILGPRIIIVLQNRYYNGYSPVRYYQNYRRTYYQPRYVVVPKYRNINVNHYRIERDRFLENQRGFRSNNGNQYGRNNSGNSQGIFREGTRNETPNYGNDRNSGFRGENNSTWNQGGMRNGSRETQSNPVREIQRNSGNEQGGFRGGIRNEQIQNNPTREIQRSSNDQSGFRGGMRSGQTENRSSSDRGTGTVLRSGGREGGFR